MAFLSHLFGNGQPGAWWWRQVRRVYLAVLPALLLFSLPLPAQESNLTGNAKELTVAFLYNFALYTEWPTPLEEGLTLCILGNDALGTALDALSSRLINGKPVRWHRLESSRPDLTGCHMVYLANASSVNLDLRRKPILSVKEGANDGFALISLGRDGNRLVFDINHTDARAAGLTLSSKLLRLARSVR